LSRHLDGTPTAPAVSAIPVSGIRDFAAGQRPERKLRFRFVRTPGRPWAQRRLRRRYGKTRGGEAFAIAERLVQHGAKVAVSSRKLAACQKVVTRRCHYGVGREKGAAATVRCGLSGQPKYPSLRA
jgi:hypothetical protein